MRYLKRPHRRPRIIQLFPGELLRFFQRHRRFSRVTPVTVDRGFNAEAIADRDHLD